MTTAELLRQVQTVLPNDHEKGYFLTHSERYRIVLEHISSLAGEKKLRILDVGCFPYHLPRALELMGHDVYGISSQHEPIHNKNIKVLNIEQDRFPWKTDFF
jgi:2-polyprenyl-3-methyl-5-hydroxy-6-metoxy-1,4-benzoquinol methylase